MRVIVKTDTAEVILTDRLAVMVEFLVTHADEIRDIPVGKVLLSFSGRAVAPELVRHYRPLKNEGERSACSGEANSYLVAIVRCRANVAVSASFNLGACISPPSFVLRYLRTYPYPASLAA